MKKQMSKSCLLANTKADLMHTCSLKARWGCSVLIGKDDG